MEVTLCRATAAASASADAAAEASGTRRELELQGKNGAHVVARVDERSVVSAAELAKAGILVYDPGFMNTACCTSRITYIDGDAGILRYRGYPIEEIAPRKTYVDVAWLLFHGEFPSTQQAASFGKAISSNCTLNLAVERVVQAFEPDAHPMGVLASAVAAWGTAEPQLNPALVGSAVYEDAARRAAVYPKVLGGFLATAAAVYNRMEGRSSAAVLRGGLPQSSTFGNMFLELIGKRDLPDSVSHALDVLLILHADHEQNCSTATMRQLTSSGVDLFSALSGSVCALYGPLHGGATEAVLKMLHRVQTTANVPMFLQGVKDRKEKMMGFGHRVYKNYDPRAKLIRSIAHTVLRELRVSNPLLDVAHALEQAALSDSYFVERKLYPNVDFYSGIIYSAIGFRPEFFPVLFALGRVSGWMSHWNEFLLDEHQEMRIARPRQVYAGSGERHLDGARAKL